MLVKWEHYCSQRNIVVDKGLMRSIFGSVIEHLNIDMKLSVEINTPLDGWFISIWSILQNHIPGYFGHQTGKFSPIFTKSSVNVHIGLLS